MTIPTRRRLCGPDTPRPLAIHHVEVGMSSEEVEVLVVGGGQAGLAMSEHLSDCGVPHLVLERHRIAERWRSERWDSLVANGPAWHDRFPGLEFVDLDPDAFASKEQVADYFVAYAEKIAAPDPVRGRGDVGEEERRPSRLSGRDVRRSHRRPLRRRRHRAVPAAGLPADRSRRRGPPADPLQRLPQPGAAARGRRPRGRSRIIGRPDRRRAAAVGAARLPLRRAARPASAQLSRARLLLVARSPGHVGRRDASPRVPST